MRADSTPSTAPFRLLLASPRWAAHTFFASLRRRGLAGLVVEPFPLDPTTVDARREELDRATALAVDIAVDPQAAIDLVRAVRTGVPSVPVLGLICCPQSLNPWHLQTVVAIGASLLDLQATPEEAVRALDSVARGSAVLQLHLRRGHRDLLRDVLTGRDDARASKVRMLELIACGLSDREIGARLHLSPHTVKHHIESLRDEVGARNRTELAAWAGRHGFYAPEADAVPFQTVRSGR